MKLAEEARLLLGEGRGHELRGEHEVAAEWSDGYRKYNRESSRQSYKRCCAMSLPQATRTGRICEEFFTRFVWVYGSPIRRVSLQSEQSIGVPLDSESRGVAKAHLRCDV